LMDNYEGPQPINIGSGKDLSIKELALTLKDTVDFNGELIFDSTKPGGAPRKLMDVSRLTEMG
jgi:GDP-L-fucose synthase